MSARNQTVYLWSLNTSGGDGLHRPLGIAIISQYRFRRGYG